MPLDIINKQAVVIIHGMGEQRPNATLRGFVRCLVQQIIGSDEEEADLDIFDKPDRVSGSYETRRMVIPRNLDKGRPTTHVYEFYWAHHMRDTSWKHILGWLSRLLLRWPTRIPPRLRKVFYTIWGLAIVTLALYFLFLPRFTHFFKVAGSIAWLVFLLGALGKFLNSAIVNSLGDAARYMSDSPDNIEQRQKIRQEGISLLRDLHAEENAYDRIILASHSLGTVVAYDLLRLLWVELSETYDKDTAPYKQLALEEIERSGPNLRKLEKPTETQLNEFRDKQYRCWREQRGAGNRWKVTDLVTMGSPLTYMDYLILSSRKEFEERIKEKEYPICPPYPDRYPAYMYHRDMPLSKLDDKGKPYKLKLLNYSSLYGCIRWTNLFFSTDFIGGPLRPLLGNGIKDQEILVKKLPRWVPFPFGHTRYWEDKANNLSAMEEIAAALQLNCNPPIVKQP